MNQGIKLRIARIKSGLRIKQVAEMVKLSASYLANIEGNRRNPPPDLLRRLATIYHVDAKELI